VRSREGEAWGRLMGPGAWKSKERPVGGCRPCQRRLLDRGRGVWLLGPFLGLAIGRGDDQGGRRMGGSSLHGRVPLCGLAGVKRLPQ
jgi:hypothetical protein